MEHETNAKWRQGGGRTSGGAGRRLGAFRQTDPLGATQAQDNEAQNQTLASQGESHKHYSAYFCQIP
eukprot:4528809-Pyramimonas_sp.AAC.1